MVCCDVKEKVIKRCRVEGWFCHIFHSNPMSGGSLIDTLLRWKAISNKLDPGKYSVLLDKTKKWHTHQKKLEICLCLFENEAFYDWI